MTPPNRNYRIIISSCGIVLTQLEAALWLVEENRLTQVRWFQDGKETGFWNGSGCSPQLASACLPNHALRRKTNKQNDVTARVSWTTSVVSLMQPKRANQNRFSTHVGKDTPHHLSWHQKALVETSCRMEHRNKGNGHSQDSTEYALCGAALEDDLETNM